MKSKGTSSLTIDGYSYTNEILPIFKRQYNGNLDDTESLNVTASMNYSEHDNNEIPFILTDKLMDEAINKSNIGIGSGLVLSNHLKHMGNK